MPFLTTACWNTLRPGGIPSIFTLMSDICLENFLHQTAALSQAGVPLEKGLRSIATQFSGKWRYAALDMADSLGRGDTFHVAAGRHSECFDSTTLALIAAGEKSGQISALLDHASALAEKRRKLVERLLRQLAYPLFIYHAAVLIPSIRYMLLDGLPTAVGVILAGLAPLYLIILGLWFVFRTRNSDMAAAARIDGILIGLPGVRPVIQSYATQNFCRCLRAFLLAGTTFREAIPASANAIGSPAAVLDLEIAEAKLNQGETLAPALSHCRFLNENSRSLISTGELSGTLPDMLEKAAVLAEDDFSGKSALLVHFLTGATFLIALAMVLFQAFSIYMPIINQMNSLLK
ncbi:MAG: type II secretion system F family protein [Methylacidiphilales bacterium]|nr:type II secretion system F family protein [Candidatus Methylacidiphilales bacterium]